MRTIEQQDFLFKTKPYQHQRDVFEASRDKENFALLMEMGTGKTKVIIDNAAWLYSKGKINFLLVAAPNEVQNNWIEREIPAHLPDWIERRTCVWSGKMKKADWDDFHALFDPEFDGLRIMALNFEQFSVGKKNWLRASARKDRPNFGQAIRSVMNSFNVLFAVDESSKIKTPGATRTDRITNIGAKALYRRIMTGTLGGPLEAYAQFKFLDPDILGYRNFYGYKHHFADWKKIKLKAKPGVKGREREREYEELQGYRNIEELQEKIAGHSYRVLKKECLDLPDKVYKRRLVQLSPDQKRKYELLKKQSILELEKALKSGEKFVPVASVLTRYLRLQQIVGGWLPDVENPDEPAVPIFDKPEKNPRIKAMMDVIEENSEQQIIIWARFRAEIEAITGILNSVYGKGSAVAFYGGTSKEDRKDAIDGFQAGKYKFFVANAQSGGYGLTLTAATCVIYYSNIFGYLEARLQSEDRCHRIGQTNKVLYVDLEAEGTIDQKIMLNLLDKKELSDIVVGDDPSAWF
jgi:SNF2 family DNA or RNA helicase